MRKLYIFSLLTAIFPIVLISQEEGNENKYGSIIYINGNNGIPCHPNGDLLSRKEQIRLFRIQDGSLVNFKILGVNPLMKSATISESYSFLPEADQAIAGVYLNSDIDEMEEDEMLMSTHDNNTEDQSNILAKIAMYNNLYLQLKAWSYLDIYITELNTPFINKLTPKMVDNYLQSMSPGISINDINIKSGEYLQKLDELYISIQSENKIIDREANSEEISLEGSLTNEQYQLEITGGQLNLQFEQPYKEFISEIEEIQQIIHKDSFKMKLVKSINSALTWYKMIEDDEAFYLYDSCFIMHDDEVMISLRLQGKDNSVIHIGDYQLYNVGKWKLNTSAGYLMSFPFNKEARYTVAATTRKESDQYGSDSIIDVVGVSLNPRKNFKQSFGALFNFYRLNGKKFHIGGSTGISISTEGKFGFHGGISVFLTERDRICLTFGLSYLQLEELNTYNLKEAHPDNENDNLKYEFISNSNNEVKYETVFRPSMFFGMTFNLNSLKKIE